MRTSQGSKAIGRPGALVKPPAKAEAMTIPETLMKMVKYAI